MLLRNRILSFTLASGMALAGAVILQQFKQSEDLPAPMAKREAQSELLRLDQLEADLAALKALAVSGADQDGSQVTAKLDALRREMSALGAARAAVDNSHEPGAAGEPRGELPDAADEIFAEQERSQQLAEHLDEVLASEAADPTWSVIANQEISRSLMDPALEKTQLTEVHCQTTLCRIEARHGDFDAEQGFIMQLGRLETFRESEAFVERVEHSDGSVATTIFVSRSGHRLPDPPGGTGSQS